jgi:hypothetical protein
VEPVFLPVPPVATVKIPELIFVAFKVVKPAPEPIKFVAVKVLLELFQVKLADCNNSFVPLPINN